MADFFDKNKIIISLIFSIIVIGGYGYFSYYTEKSDILKSIDEKLISSAIATHVIIGDDFIDRARTSASISPQEDMKNIISLSKLAKASGVKYLYLMTLDSNHTIRFLASSATDEEISTGNQLSRYYDSYENNHYILDALKTKQTMYQDFTEDA